MKCDKLTFSLGVTLGFQLLHMVVNSIAEAVIREDTKHLIAGLLVPDGGSPVLLAMLVDKAGQTLAFSRGGTLPTLDETFAIIGVSLFSVSIGHRVDALKHCLRKVSADFRHCN